MSDEAAPEGATYLTGERVRLAPPEPGHAEVLARWLNDPEVWVPFGMDRPASVEGERQWIASLPSRTGEMALLVFEKDSDRPVGLVGLRNIDGANGTARLAVLIGERADRGDGLGTEAVTLILRHSFDYLGLRRVNLSVLEGNEAALALYAKLGFVEEGRERAAQLRGGKFVDRLHFGLLREEFRAGS
ncbi:MAG: GNAT family N-acetyltransferase [Planctomycetota bacterium]